MVEYVISIANKIDTGFKPRAGDMLRGWMKITAGANELKYGFRTWGKSGDCGLSIPIEVSVNGKLKDATNADKPDSKDKSSDDKLNLSEQYRDNIIKFIQGIKDNKEQSEAYKQFAKR